MQISKAGLVAAMIVVVTPGSAIASGPQEQARLIAALTSTVDRVGAPGVAVPGILLAVRAPRHRIRFDHAAGFRERVNAGSALPPALRADDEFRIASVTKTFTAAAILRLTEQGPIALDDTIIRHLSEETTALLMQGGYQASEITVRQLLNHTSGLYDYATDPGYLAAISENPGRLWLPNEQIALAMRNGKPAPPGKSFAYSDTGYALLAEIIVRSTGTSFAKSLSDLIGFARLGLTRTYLESAPAGPVIDLPANRVHQYQDDIDTTRLNPSFDLYGGGGLVSTTQDLATFFEALLGGRVFQRPATLDAMLTIPPGVAADRETEPYALGIKPMRYGAARCWGHFGHWGIVAATCPALGLSFAFAGNAAGDRGYAALAEVQTAVDRFAGEIAAAGD